MITSRIFLCRHFVLFFLFSPFPISFLLLIHFLAMCLSVFFPFHSLSFTSLYLFSHSFCISSYFSSRYFFIYSPVFLWILTFFYFLLSDFSLFLSISILTSDLYTSSSCYSFIISFFFSSSPHFSLISISLCSFQSFIYLIFTCNFS